MYVAARGKLAGIEICVRVQPQHPQLPALLTAVARYGADRADAQAMVPAQQDRQSRLAQLNVDRLVHELVPAHYLGQVAVAARGRLPGVARSAQVTQIHDLEVTAAKSRGQARYPQRLRSHRCAAVRSPDIGGCADEARRP